MTDAQIRATRELSRICQSSNGAFGLLSDSVLHDGGILARIFIRIGPIENREGGLQLREVEEFNLLVPSGFPFDRPQLWVSHKRFAGFPHVTWGKTICLYQSDNEWNPSDGLYGFFDRLDMWLTKAAINDMDPVDGPLEPPHHVTDFSQKPFVVRSNAPCAAGERWIGVALLEDYPNRTELIGWDDLSGKWPEAGRVAFAAMIPEPISSEFPENGKHLFSEFEKARLDRDSFIRFAALAALITPEGEPIHFVLGFPMRRSPDGSPRIHIAVWTASAEWAKSLRTAFPTGTDSDEIKILRDNLRKAIVAALEESTISWCKVLEDRPELILRRDATSATNWFNQKNVLILGCGALGSWATDAIARSGASSIQLVDNGIVKPGVLVRQNFALKSIAVKKAIALADRVREIANQCTVTAHVEEAHKFLVENRDRIAEFDLILDCTASSTMQMKLERDWALFGNSSPSIVSILIDSNAKHCIAVVLSKTSSGGPWNAYVSLKHSLCISGGHHELCQAFYADRSNQPMFLPEPGCSDPTFIGSTADVLALLSPILNTCAEHLSHGLSAGIALTLGDSKKHVGPLDSFPKIEFIETIVGKYRVRLANSIFKQARGWVNQNARIRGRNYETGGLLWGNWDDAVNVIWIFDASGPPPDSLHSPAEFLCGTEGTVEDHNRRMKRTFGGCGFVGHWHTHPEIPSEQSATDLVNMAGLVSTLGGNQKRSLMLIFGRTYGTPTAGLYVYESESALGKGDLISVGDSQIELESPVA